MKPRKLITFVLTMATAISMTSQINAASLGTAFTYQGQLTDGGQPAQGAYDFRFALYDADGGGSLIAGPITNTAVAVSNGLFTVMLDFGSGVFTGDERWLQTAVRSNGSGVFQALAPSQGLTATPHAQYAGKAGGAATLTAPLAANLLSGTYGQALALSNPANNLTGNGSGLTSLNANNLSSGTVAEGRIDTTLARDGEVFPLVTANDGAGSGLDADLLDGQHASAFATAAHGHSGADITSGTLNDARLSSNVALRSGGNVFTGNQTMQQNDGRLVLRTPTRNNPGRMGIQFSNNVLGLFLGDDTQEQTFGFYTAFNSQRTNDARLRVFGKANTSWGKYLELAHDGTDGYVSTDGGALKLSPAGSPALRLEATGSNSVNVIGGYGGNNVRPWVVGATIGGGGAGNWNYTAWSHSVESHFGTIGGGYANSISNYGIVTADDFEGIGTTISGGGSNRVFRSNLAAIGGGWYNAIHSSGNSTIAGGHYNAITNAWQATIGGGGHNYIGSNADAAVIGGGSGNSIESDAVGAVIPGGTQNSAQGALSFAAGLRAYADHDGAFVWADSTGSTIHSTNANSVTMRASGGYRLFSTPTAGVYLAPGGGSWTSMSDRNAKEDFVPVNTREVLSKVTTLPLATWKYRSQDASIRHIGPMAQDFHAAFGVGESDTGITGVDADGVALAAIQGLNEKVESGKQKAERRMEKLEGENAALREQVAELRRLMSQLSAKLGGGGQ